ncbi:MAG: nickel-dependent lactate racemase [bacterium]
MYSVTKHGRELTYRDEVEDVTLTLPVRNFEGLITIEEPVAAKWPDALQSALSNPIGSRPLAELVCGHKRVAIIIPDSTRGVPVAQILPQLVTNLAAEGLGLDAITVVVATGVHRPATSEELDNLLGSLKGKIKIINHDAFEKEELVFLGTTTRGTPVEVNRTVYESDFRIAIGKVEPHEFAGFSGGRKAILPGVSAEHTIEINHRPEMLLVSEASPGVLEGNPVSEDMVEAAIMSGLNFVVNVVQGATGEILEVFAGDMEAAHRAAVQYLRSFCQVDLKRRPDIVVTTPGKPLNIDFYQSLKAVIALEHVMTPDGTIVLYSACPDGLGTTDMFKPYEGARCIDDVIDNLKATYKIQMDHALLVCKVLAHGVHVIASSPNVPSCKLESVMFENADSPQEALDKALSRSEDAMVLFYPQPQRTLPNVLAID